MAGGRSGVSLAGHFQRNASMPNGGGLYENVVSSLEDFYKSMGKFSKGLREGGEMSLPNGDVIDPTSLGGMSYFSVYLKTYESHMGLLQEVFKFVIKVEQKLGSN